MHAQGAYAPRRTGRPMRLAPSIHTADLGPKTAAFIAVLNGQPIAIVNRAAFTDRVVRDQAAHALAAAGFDADRITGALPPES